MLNILWPFFIIISFLYSILTGNIEKLNNSIFEYSSNAVELSIVLLGTMCLWCGIIKILEKTSFMGKFSKLIRPLIMFLFPELKNDNKAMEEISLNIIANILGLGNAATPLGLKAMETMQKDNKKKDTVTNSMAMLIVINTASLQIIPTSVIAIRNSLNSISATSVILPIWIATICAAISGITATKLFIKFNK